jgi:hypothetical protein
LELRNIRIFFQYVVPEYAIDRFPIWQFHKPCEAALQLLYGADT